MNHDPDDGETVIYYGGAKPNRDLNWATVHCVDNEIIEWLERREPRGRAAKGRTSARVNLHREHQA